MKNEEYSYLHLRDRRRYEGSRRGSAGLSAMLGLAYLFTTAVCADGWKRQKQSMPRKPSTK